MCTLLRQASARRWVPGGQVGEARVDGLADVVVLLRQSSVCWWVPGGQLTRCVGMGCGSAVAGARDAQPVSRSAAMTGAANQARLVGGWMTLLDMRSLPSGLVDGLSG